MKAFYLNQALPKGWSSAIYLAGPTFCADAGAVSWRRDALAHLERLGYDGVVFVPEFKHSDDTQESSTCDEWKERCLECADAIVFWTPRELTGLASFAENEDWGFCI